MFRFDRSCRLAFTHVYLWNRQQKANEDITSKRWNHYIFAFSTSLLKIKFTSHYLSDIFMPKGELWSFVITPTVLHLSMRCLSGTEGVTVTVWGLSSECHTIQRWATNSRWIRSSQCFTDWASLEVLGGFRRPWRTENRQGAPGKEPRPSRRLG